MRKCDRTTLCYYYYEAVQTNHPGIRIFCLSRTTDKEEWLARNEEYMYTYVFYANYYMHGCDHGTSRTEQYLFV